MSSINCWNCFKFRRGPRLMLHRTGRMSMATKSASAACPTTRRTLRAAIMTAGSFVLMALINGMIFSCMVYLSNAVEDDVFLLAKPFKPSSAMSLDPPQRMTKACRPLTLMAKLLVLLKMDATTGNNSFLIVLKSSTGKIVGNDRNAASTSDGVADSNAT